MTPPWLHDVLQTCPGWSWQDEGQREWSDDDEDFHSAGSKEVRDGRKGSLSNIHLELLRIMIEKKSVSLAFKAVAASY